MLDYRVKAIIEGADDESPSKSQLKREMLRRQTLGENLTRLGPAQLAQIPLDDTLREAIADYQRFKQREAKRRQLQFIGRLMRAADCDAIERAWEATQAGSEAAKKFQYKLERWRNRLIAESDEAINQLLAEYPDVDRQALRQLVREAVKEMKESKAPAASRKIFRFLKPYLAE